MRRPRYDGTVIAAGAFWALVSACGAKHGKANGHADGATAYDSSFEDAPDADGGAGVADTAGVDGGFELVGAPLIFAPTMQGFGLNVVVRSGDPLALGARVRDEASLDWIDLGIVLDRFRIRAGHRQPAAGPGGFRRCGRDSPKQLHPRVERPPRLLPCR